MNKDKPFSEVVYNSFQSVLKSAGIAVDMQRIELLNRSCHDFATRMEHMTKKKAIEVAEMLQKATMNAFTGFEEELEKAKDELKKENKRLQTKVNKLEKKLADLEARTFPLK